MPDNVNDMQVGMRTVAQIPLDAKLWILNEAALANLGTNNNLAYTYYIGMVVHCAAEGSYWKWRERAEDEPVESVSLLAEDFIYPDGLPPVNEYDYALKAFNFFKTEAIQGIPGPAGPQGPQGPAGNDGNDGNPGAPGQDLTEADFQLVLLNPADFPSGNYLIDAIRNKYTLYVSNGAADVTITIDDTLIAGAQGKMFFFIQVGTGKVTFVAGSGVTVMFMDNDTTPKTQIKGQGHWASVVQAFGTSTFNVFGSMKAPV